MLRLRLTALITAAAFAAAWPAVAGAHCDALDGPVVDDARQTLQRGNLDPVLKWIPSAGEAEVRAAYDRARRVRAAGGDAAALADTWFFETVVRVHRAGEGAPFTGLKPAGRDFGPAITAADRAIHDGDGGEVTRILLDAVRHGLDHRLQQVRTTAAFTDVDGGRDHVHAYVEFVHYVERLHHAASTAAHPAAREGEAH